MRRSVPRRRCGTPVRARGCPSHTGETPTHRHRASWHPRKRPRRQGLRRWLRRHFRRPRRPAHRQPTLRRLGRRLASDSMRTRAVRIGRRRSGIAQPRTCFDALGRGGGGGCDAHLVWGAGEAGSALPGDPTSLVLEAVRARAASSERAAWKGRDTPPERHPPRTGQRLVSGDRLRSADAPPAPLACPSRPPARPLARRLRLCGHAAPHAL